MVQDQFYISELTKYLLGGVVGWLAATKGHREFFFKEKFLLYRSLSATAAEAYLDAFLSLVLENEEYAKKVSSSTEALRVLVVKNGLLISEETGTRIERLHECCLGALGRDVGKDELKAAHQGLMAQLGKELRVKHLSTIPSLLFPGFPFVKTDDDRGNQPNKHLKTEVTEQKSDD